MKERLGSAISLIDDEKYLPMFRNRQIHHEELFNYSVELAQKKRNPSRYFASIWGRKNLQKTISWLQKTVNLLKSKIARELIESKNQLNELLIKKEATKNFENIRKLRKMQKSYGIRS